MKHRYFLSEGRCRSSTAIRSNTATRIRKVAAARIAGLISSRTPDHISRGMVRCSIPPMNNTITTSSSEAAKANKAPEMTPGLMMGNWTLKKLYAGPAPRLVAASRSSR